MKALIAIGGADCAWEDFDKALELCPNADVGACNDAGADFRGHLSIWATLHAERFWEWQRRRALKGLNEDYIAVSNKGHANTRVDRIQNEFWSGTSGLYLCQVALSMGYDKVIACGMPLDSRPHYFDSSEWEPHIRYRRGWKEALGQREVQGRIKSMSGWTRELCGDPTKEWLSVTA